MRNELITAEEARQAALTCIYEHIKCCAKSGQSYFLLQGPISEGIKAELSKKGFTVKASYRSKFTWIRW